MSSVEEIGYAAAAQQYWDNGWRSVLPLPHGEKKPPPKNYTGTAPLTPSYPDVMAWMEDNPDGNLALRFPPGVVGLDVDAYGAKTGEAALIEGLNRWGPLPPTVRSTSRHDNVSGIRLYRIPPEIQLHSEIRFRNLDIANVEIVQATHRYCVAWPSIHPDTGDMYQWLDADGNITEVPNIDELPMLPQRWIDGLRADRLTEVTATADPQEMLRGMPDGQMSDAVIGTFIDAVKHLDCHPGSRHDECMKDVLRLIRLGEKGEPGVKLALEKLGIAFAHATRDRNSEPEARQEFRRMVYGQRGHDLIASTPSEEGDLRALGQTPPAKLSAASSAPATPTPEELLQTELGAERIEEEEDQSDVDTFLFGSTDKPTTRKAEKVEQRTGPIDEDQPTTMRDRLLTVAGLAGIEPAEPLVDRLLYRNTLAQLSGPPGSYKSFVTLGLACAVASNLESWQGHAIPKNGTVIYVAAEGSSGLQARIHAWCEQQNVDPDTLKLYVYPDAIDLGSYTQVGEITDLADEMDALLVVFDTRARCTVGLEENSATEQGKAIAAAETIRKASGCTVLCVHHGSRSNASTPRGSNSWDGAVWSDLRVKNDTGKDLSMTIHVEKHKDVADNFDVTFQMLPWTVSPERMPDTKERARETLVPVMPDERQQKAKMDSPMVNQILESLKTALSDGISVKELMEEYGCSRNTVREPMNMLVRLGRVKNVGSQTRPKYRLVEE